MPHHSVLGEADIAIVGGGLGAVRTAQALRTLGFDGSIAIVSEEAGMPYDRPPLSKNFLRGSLLEDEIHLLARDRYDELQIELTCGRRAIALDCASHRVSLAGGGELSYGRLVVATGARARTLPILHGRDNVRYLRTLDDARRLRQALLASPRTAILGGGFIGLEVAAVAREIGCAVTVLEAAETPLAAVLGTELGGWIQGWHEDHGVQFLCGSQLGRARGERKLTELLTEDGRRTEADIVVAGIGIVPAVGWLRGSGLALHNGLRCDAEGRSSDPDVFGVGDAVCRHRGSACLPSGHWTGTSEQAQIVAAAMLGADDARHSVREGYFWSDQYDTRLQFTGTVSRDPVIELLSGRIEDDRFVAACGDGDRITGIFAVGSPRDFVRASVDLSAQQTTGVN